MPPVRRKRLRTIEQLLSGLLTHLVKSARMGWKLGGELGDLGARVHHQRDIVCSVYDIRLGGVWKICKWSWVSRQPDDSTFAGRGWTMDNDWSPHWAEADGGVRIGSKLCPAIDCQTMAPAYWIPLTTHQINMKSPWWVFKIISFK